MLKKFFSFGLFGFMFFVFGSFSFAQNTESELYPLNDYYNSLDTSYLISPSSTDSVNDGGYTETDPNSGVTDTGTDNTYPSSDNSDSYTTPSNDGEIVSDNTDTTPDPDSGVLDGTDVGSESGEGDWTDGLYDGDTGLGDWYDESDSDVNVIDPDLAATNTGGDDIDTTIDTTDTSSNNGFGNLRGDGVNMKTEKIVDEKIDELIDDKDDDTQEKIEKEIIVVHDKPDYPSPSKVVDNIVNGQIFVVLFILVGFIVGVLAWTFMGFITNAGQARRELKRSNRLYKFSVAGHKIDELKEVYDPLNDSLSSLFVDGKIATDSVVQLKKGLTAIDLFASDETRVLGKELFEVVSAKKIDFKKIELVKDKFLVSFKKDLGL